MVVRQDAYLTSRASAMQNVESTIHELGGIFQQLAHMVRPPFIRRCSTMDCQILGLICTSHLGMCHSTRVTPRESWTSKHGISGVFANMCPCDV